ncbi:GNAT family N-acetyltransferase [Frigoriglobus tundricola]|uniref:Acetyltransferase (GNAT) family protein n=1 Tax=Frigoriglobus tundricola TaxID=2774151 RepID=A0A6M5Z0W8_9BACT|nr:GNAT family N-acetyltransferase [Frigoriglobus tundricola]QJW99815.1 Acetyltransferase (GNAT) family protein [Frigoriglobus tundricola]
MFRPASPTETPVLVALAAATGIFQPQEAELLLGGVLDDLHAGRLGEGHSAQVWTDSADGPPVGWVYFAPTAKADGVWDLWWIGVAPNRQGQGVGDELLRFVENHVRSAGGRLLLIETSSTPAFDPVRRFYAKRGYSECGVVPDFYAEGDGKVIYAKKIAAPV